MKDTEILASLDTKKSRPTNLSFDKLNTNVAHILS